MARKKTSEHQEIIRRLFEADQGAGDRIENAREEADGIVDDARKEAEQLVEKARKEAESEAESIVRKAENEAGGRTETAKVSDRIRTLRRQGQENKDRAVAFLVDWVIGKTDSESGSGR